MTLNPHDDRALSAKWPLFTWPGFCIASAIFFGIWWLLSSRLRYWSLKQDETGDAALHLPDAVPFRLGDSGLRGDA